MHALVINSQRKDNKTLRSFLEAEGVVIEEASELSPPAAHDFVVLDASCANTRKGSLSVFQTIPKLWLVHSFEELNDIDVSQISQSVFLMFPCHGKVFRQGFAALRSNFGSESRFISVVSPPSRSSIGPIVDLLVRFTEAKAAVEKHLVLGLSELVRNGYEHGCLGISTSQKDALILDGEFDRYTAEAEVDAVKDGHWIDIHALHGSNSEVRFRLEDTGDGFDWRSVDLDAIPMSEGVHGKGLFLIKKLFETFSFNEKGNVAEVTKKIV